MKKPFHLAWFLSQGYGPKTWRSDWPGSDMHRWMMPDLFIDLAKGIERGCFDYMIIEDSSNVPYTYKGTHDTYLQYGASAPKLDPAVLVPYLAKATTHLGLVPTLSVSEYPPYLLARLVNSLDHVTEGPHRLELRDRQQRRRGAELRHRQASSARRALRRGRRVRRCRDQAVGGVGTGRGGAGPRDPDVRRRPQGPSHQPRGQILQGAWTDQRAALAAGPGCRSARPAARRAASASPRGGPTRSSTMRRLRRP